MNHYRVNTNCNNLSRNSRYGRMRAVGDAKYVFDTKGCRVMNTDTDDGAATSYDDLATCITANKNAVDAMMNKDSCACASDSTGKVTAGITPPGYAGLATCTTNQGACYKAALDACVKSKSTCKLTNMSSGNQAIFYTLIGVAGLLLIAVFIMVGMRYHKGAKVGAAPSSAI